MIVIYRKCALVLSAVILLSFSAPSLSENRLKIVEKEVALDVIREFKNIPRITSSDKWLADQWAFYAAHCAHEADIDLPKELRRYRPSTPGSWTMPKDSSEACSALQNGPTLECGILRATQPPFTTPPKGGRTEYIYLSQDITGKIPVMVGGYCNLVSGERSTRQFFAVEAVAEWKIPPIIKQFNMPSGFENIKAGTMSFSVEGLPVQYSTVIMPSPP